MEPSELAKRFYIDRSAQRIGLAAAAGPAILSRISGTWVEPMG